MSIKTILVGAIMIVVAAGGVMAQTPSVPMYWIEDVVIDGEFDEWDDVESAVTENSLYGDHEPRDAEAKVTLATDGETLYVYADVRDDVPRANAFHSALAWKDDSLDVYFGPSATQREEYNDDDSQVRLIPRSKEDPLEGSVFIGFDAAGGGVPLDRVAEIATIYGRRGYEIEAAIPLSSLNIATLRMGQRTRCDFQLNDADEQERDRLVRWSSMEDDYFTPANWGFCEIETQSDE